MSDSTAPGTGTDHARVANARSILGRFSFDKVAGLFATCACCKSCACASCAGPWLRPWPWPWSFQVVGDEDCNDDDDDDDDDGGGDVVSADSSPGAELLLLPFFLSSEPSLALVGDATLSESILA